MEDLIGLLTFKFDTDLIRDIKLVVIYVNLQRKELSSTAGRLNKVLKEWFGNKRRELIIDRHTNLIK